MSEYCWLVPVSLYPEPNLIYTHAETLFCRLGAAGIGLTLGQIGVGLGTSLGHASAISRLLSVLMSRLISGKIYMA